VEGSHVCQALQQLETQLEQVAASHASELRQHDVHTAFLLGRIQAVLLSRQQSQSARPGQHCNPHASAVPPQVQALDALNKQLSAENAQLACEAAFFKAHAMTAGAASLQSAAQQGTAWQAVPAAGPSGAKGTCVQRAAAAHAKAMRQLSRDHVAALQDQYRQAQLASANDSEAPPPACDVHADTRQRASAQQSSLAVPALMLELECLPELQLAFGCSALDPAPWARSVLAIASAPVASTPGLPLGDDIASRHISRQAQPSEQDTVAACHQDLRRHVAGQEAGARAGQEGAGTCVLDSVCTALRLRMALEQASADSRQMMLQRARFMLLPRCQVPSSSSAPLCDGTVRAPLREVRCMHLWHPRLRQSRRALQCKRARTHWRSCAAPTLLTGSEWRN
jgi:hypothetical protein